MTERDGLIDLPTVEHDAVLQKVVARMQGHTTPKIVKIGRYEFIRRLGAGGMGIVYLARDPDLDRLIALKVLHPSRDEEAELTAAERRMVREARAMARLDHPHVVTVHEVGEDAGRTYIAMEYVEGTTLGHWLERREHRWSETVRIFLAAGEGLAAAHAEGLAHCDFKPDNVLIGEGGAIKVSDFGLAHHHEVVPQEPGVARASTHTSVRLTTDTDTLRGTPAFMAPEQFEGHRGDPRSDQFSYCVALYTALYGTPPFGGPTLDARLLAIRQGQLQRPTSDGTVPAALRPVIVRGLRFDPDARWASMDALLRQLRWALGAPARRRRRALAGLGAVVSLTVAGVLAYERYTVNVRTEACQIEGERITRVWGDLPRAHLRDRLLATGASYAATTADKITPWLDRYAAQWRDHRSRACLDAEVHQRLGPEPLARARWCLDAARIDLRALIDAFDEADARMLTRAVSIAISLPSTARCVDPAVLETLPVPPEQSQRDIAELRAHFARARVLVESGLYQDAVGPMGDILRRAEALGWDTFTAEVRGLHGRLLLNLGSFEEAAALIAEAYSQAARARAWAVASGAANDAMTAVGYRQARYGEARVWSRSAEVAEVLAGDPMGLLRAERLDTLGVVEHEAGNYARAEALHREALALQEAALGPEHPLLVDATVNLANARKAQGDLDSALALLDRALAREEETVGPDNPVLAPAINNMAVTHLAAGRTSHARALFERALAIRRAALGPDHRDVATSSSNLGTILLRMGDYDRALDLLQEAADTLTRIHGPEHPDVAKALFNLAMARDEAGYQDEAEAIYLHVLALLEDTLGPEHPDVSPVLAELAAHQMARGDLDGARARLGRAIAVDEKALGPEHPRVAKRRASLEQLEGAEPEDRAPKEPQSRTNGATAAP